MPHSQQPKYCASLSITVFTQTPRLATFISFPHNLTTLACMNIHSHFFCCWRCSLVTLPSQVTKGTCKKTFNLLILFVALAHTGWRYGHVLRQRGWKPFGSSWIGHYPLRMVHEERYRFEFHNTVYHFCVASEDLAWKSQRSLLHQSCFLLWSFELVEVTSDHNVAVSPGLFQ